MQEIWKPVVGYEGLYEVSNLGRVKSLPRNGTKGGIITDIDNKNGYRKVVLSNVSKKTKLVHILVAESFLEYKSNKCVIVVDHINNLRHDNRLSNLRVISHRENLIKDSVTSSLHNNIYVVGNRFRVILFRKHIGYFNTLEEAITARNNKLLNYE